MRSAALLWSALVGVVGGPAVAQSAPRHVVFTWQGDTSTTLCVNFQTSGARPLPARVYWDVQPRGGNVRDYAFQAEGTSFRIEGLNDRWLYRVPLKGLAPGRSIHLVAGDPELGISREYEVRTIANDGSKLRFVTGGDMGPSADTRTLLRHAARQDPDFVLIGGDIAYANGDARSIGHWDTWLTYWSEEMRTSDGRTIPVALAIGNHEVRGGYGQPPSHAPFFFGFFGQDERSFAVRKFGTHLAAWLLDSGHVEPHGPEQAAWLDRTLQEFAAVPHKIAVYHVPLYPSHRLYGGDGSREGRQFWAPLFDQHGLDIAFENHDHTWKRSVPLRAGEPHPEGVLYLGDGCFGQVPRAVTYGGRWYLRQQGGVQHFWCVDVDAAGMTCRAIDSRGETFDVYPETAEGAAAAAEVRSKQRTALQPVEGTVAIDPLAAPDSRWQQGEIRVVVNNTFGAPCAVLVSLHRGPEGAVLTAGPASSGDAANLLPGATVVVPVQLAVPQPIDRAAVSFRVRVACTVQTEDGPLEVAETVTVRAQPQ